MKYFSMTFGHKNLTYLHRDMFENEMREKEEEFMSELARKDEIFLTTVCQMEDKITELQEKNSVNIFDAAETPRVKLSCISNF